MTSIPEFIIDASKGNYDVMEEIIINEYSNLLTLYRLIKTDYDDIVYITFMSKVDNEYDVLDIEYKSEKKRNDALNHIYESMESNYLELSDDVIISKNNKKCLVMKVKISN